MGNAVFANGREIACKSGSGQVIAAFPDVCLSPPSPPAGPIPIPYPVTSQDSDTEQGTKSVKVDGKEVMQKDSSDFKKCSGDEACTKSLGMGVVTHQQTGKVFFVAWSMDVKIEGDNAVRHLDMVTSNHASKPGNVPPWIFKAKNGKGGVIEDCKKDKDKADKACKDLKTRKEQCDPNSRKAEKCKKAKKCLLVSYKQGSRTGKKATVGCCDDETPHHLIEVHSFTKSGGRAAGDRVKGFGRYRDGDAPCVCVKGGRGDREHGAFHALVGKRENAAVRRAAKKGKGDRAWKYKDARKAAADAHKKVFPKSGCSKKCLEAQLNGYHNKIGCDENTELRTGTQSLEDWQKKSDRAILKQMGKQLSGSP
jgi:hypothetical protein